MPNLRILLADPDSTFRANAENALKDQGYRVLPVGTTGDARNLLKSNDVDVIVADVGAACDGLELLRQARSQTPTPPVILLTVPGTIASAAAGVREGAYDYMLKPVEDYARLGALIARAGQKRETSPRVSETTPRDPDQPPTEFEQAGEFPAPISTSRLMPAAVRAESFSEIGGVFAQELAAAAGSGQALVLLIRDQAELVLAASHGFETRAEAENNYRKSSGEDFGWQVIEAREPVWLHAGDWTGRFSGYPAEILGLPLLYNGQALGAAVLPVSQVRDSFAPPTMEAVLGLCRQFSLVAELERVRSQADRLNPLDRATGVFKRAHFFELAEREFRRSWRFNESIAALELDLDDFGRLQAAAGPGSGERIVQQVALAVAPRVRSIDLIGRIEGDKLAILVLKGTKETGSRIAERLRRAVAEIEVDTPDGPWQITASIGVATYPREQCASIYDLFALASQAVRIAKRAGRNRVVSV